MSSSAATVPSPLWCPRHICRHGTAEASDWLQHRMRDVSGGYQSPRGAGTTAAVGESTVFFIISVTGNRRVVNNVGKPL